MAAPRGAGGAAPGRRAGVTIGQRPRLGPVRRRVPGHPRRVPRRRRASSGGPRGSTEDVGAGARRRRRPRRARGRVRGRPVLALGPRAGRPGGRPRPLRPPAAALAPDRRRRPASSVPAVLGTATAPALRRRLLRRRLLLLRRAAVRRRHRPWPSPRRRGCCAPAAGSRSRSPTRPGGCSPTTPASRGLTASQSYWDRTPYVEVDDATGVVAYVEHHRTLGDWVALLAGAGFRITGCSSRSGPRTTTGSGAAGPAPAAC